MKKVFKILFCLSILSVVYACSQLPELTGDNSTISDNSTDADNSTGGNPENPENPENPLPPVEPGDNNTGGNGSADDDKFAGNGSYTDRRHPARLAYFDYDNKTETDKVLRNDLTSGDLEGMIQFIQSHNIDPNGNAENFRPSLVPFRAALLTLTTNTFYKSVTATIATNGNTLEVRMDPPRDMPEADALPVATDPVTFSNKSWSMYIPEKYMEPGMTISFKAVDNNDIEKNGILEASSITYSSPQEVTYFFIRLGMLTDYPAMPNNDNYYMLSKPAVAMADYFQTTPFARVINATYEPRRLDTVILNNGTIYDITGERGLDVSSTKGDYYNGDMRQNVAKVQFSAGVNLANRGVSSSATNESKDDHQRGRDPYFLAIHHAKGKYSNGVQVHGLSGGAGMFTLSSSADNEFSHELGHGYGLGHYVDGGTTTDGVLHSFNTGWGYDSYKNRIRANLGWATDGSSPQQYQGKYVAPFHNRYNWKWDTMSGGAAKSSISKYTHLTARTTMKVQDNAKERYNLSDYKVNGHHVYLEWDFTNNRYKELDNASNPDFASRRKLPTEKGVPVITILGGYNPLDAQQAVLYPYFRANYGNVFGDLFLDTAPSTGTYLQVDFYDGSTKYVELANTAFTGSKVNKIHVNIAESSQPKKVTLFVNGDKPYRDNSTVIPSDLAPMNPAVIIGKGYGYAAVINEEVAELTAKLESQPLTYTLTSRDMEIVSNLVFNGAVNKLEGNTKAIVDAYLTKQNSIQTLNDYLDRNFQLLDEGDQQAKTSLQEKVNSIGLAPYSEFNYGVTMINNHCIYVYDNKTIAAKECPADVNDNITVKWFMDSQKRIHSAKYPGYCLEGNKVMDRVVLCSDSNAQKWNVRVSNGFLYYQNVNEPSNCMGEDLNSDHFLSIWGCNNNKVNQRVDREFYQESNEAVSYLPGSVLDDVGKYLYPEK